MRGDGNLVCETSIRTAGMMSSSRDPFSSATTDPATPDPATPDPAPANAAPPWEHDDWLTFDRPGAGPGTKRARWPLLTAIAAAFVLATGTGIALVGLPFHYQTASDADAAQNSVAADPSLPTAAPASSSASSPAPTSREQAARALSALLAQSGTDRAAVIHAASAVEDCSGGLSQDEATFSQAASGRQALLSKLAALPGRSTLPAQTLQELTLAWQASGKVDHDFVMWTRDEIARGCSKDYQSDASFHAALAPEAAANTCKNAFASLWTLIAAQYGLPVYQSSRI
jgi:hypothetical protein